MCILGDKNNFRRGESPHKPKRLQQPLFQAASIPAKHEHVVGFTVAKF
jgi:hypothetical protein